MEPRSVLPLLAAGVLGVVLLGTVEVWSGRASAFVDVDGHEVTVLLALGPLLSAISACVLVHRRLVTSGTPALAAGGRTRQAALAGWALLTVAAVLLLQAVLFGASSALVEQIGCGRSNDDWCGFGSAILGLIALAVGGSVGGLGSLLWLLTRRAAARA